MKLVRIAALPLLRLRRRRSLAADGPKWSEWSDDLFTRAAEKRFVISISKRCGATGAT